MEVKNEILILTSGSVKKLDAFLGKGADLNSFSDISWDSQTNSVKVLDNDLKDYKVVYFRMVGKSLEIASLVAKYAKANGIRIVDSLYENTNLMPSSLAKSLEMQILVNSSLPIPKTIFNKFTDLSYPFIVKSTTGQRAREVWMVKNEDELNQLKLKKFEKNKNYFAQEYIANANRIRALVVGDRVVGAIKRHTKWNHDDTKETLNPIPNDIIDLSLKASKAMNLEICGVDILTNETGKYWLIEANAAPSWKLINKYCGVVVEDEIIKYIQTKI